MAMTRIWPIDSDPLPESPGVGLADGVAVEGEVVTGTGLGETLAVGAAVAGVGSGLGASATVNSKRPRSRWPSSVAAAQRTR